MLHNRLYTSACGAFGVHSVYDPPSGTSVAHHPERVAETSILALGSRQLGAIYQRTGRPILIVSRWSFSPQLEPFQEQSLCR
jgi:hypothetical protein